MNKLEVGQTVYLVPIAGTQASKRMLKERRSFAISTIVKVGKSGFHIRYRGKFSLKTMAQDKPLPQWRCSLIQPEVL